MGLYIDTEGNEWGHCEVCNALVNVGRVLCADHKDMPCLPDCTCDGCLLERARKEVGDGV